MDLLQDVRNAKKPLAARGVNDMEQDVNKKNINHGEEFLHLLLKLNADELCALSKILGVRLLTDEIDPETKKAVPRDAYDIIDDCIVHYGTMGRADRRWLIKYLRKEVKEK